MCHHRSRRPQGQAQGNDLDWAPDVIERQLAHAERNKVRAAYSRAQYLAERRTMMVVWADHLDTLRDGAANVVLLRGKRAVPAA
jgi:hypothetical protein